MKKLHLLLLIALAFSCSKKISTGRVAEDYDSFYDRFHADNSFQLERIKFPLEGAYEDASGTVVWDTSNWIFQEEKLTEIRLPDYDTEIIREDDQVIEKIKLRGAGYESERRFQLIDGKWFLVYFDTTNL